MKILHIFKSYYPDTMGGVEEVIRQIATVAKFNKTRVDIVCLSKLVKKPKIIRYENSLIYQFPVLLDYYSTPVSVRLFLSFRKIAQKYDVLHYHYPWPFMGALHLTTLGLSEKKRVITYHADALGNKFLRSLNILLCKPLFNKADKVVVTSPNILRNNPYINFSKHQHKVLVIPLGLEEKTGKDATELKLQDHYQEKYGNQFVLFIGQFRKYKGIGNIIEAAKLLPKVNFYLVGSGKEYNNIANLVKVQNLTNINLLGKVNNKEKQALLKLCRCLILPSVSRGEAFGVVLLEAMREGKPVISTELGTGTSYVNKNGVSGWVIEPENPPQLALSIQKMDEEKEYNRLCEGAKNRFLNNFTSEKTSAKYFKIYRGKSIE